jgi:hypothetical protein
MILNHSPAQDLSNKKHAAFCVFCGLRYSNLLSFDTNALYFVRPLYRKRFELTDIKSIFTKQIFYLALIQPYGLDPRSEKKSYRILIQGSKKHENGKTQGKTPTTE